MPETPSCYKLPVSRLGTPARDMETGAAQQGPAPALRYPSPRHAKRSRGSGRPSLAEPRRASGAPPEARHGSSEDLRGGSARLTDPQESSASPVSKTSPLLAKKCIAFQCFRRSKCPGAHCCPSSSASMRAAHSFQSSSEIAWRRQPPWHCAGALGDAASPGDAPLSGARTRSGAGAGAGAGAGCVPPARRSEIPRAGAAGGGRGHVVGVGGKGQSVPHQFVGPGESNCS